MKVVSGRMALSSDGNLSAASLLSGLGALGLLAAGWHAGPTGLRHYSCIAAGAMLGISLGLMLVRSGRVELSARIGVSASEMGLVGGCGVLLGLLTYWCGMRQFGAWDQDILIDLAWRLINGQKPYVDFPCTLPVGFYLGGELAFRLFGVYWRSIIAFNSIWTCLSFLWLYGLLRCVFENRLLAFLGAVTCEALTSVTVSYWWYNPVTSICGLLYSVSVVAVVLGPRDWRRWVSLGVSLFFLSLMKPNVAGILILGGSVSLFAFRPARWPALLVSMVALLFWFLVIHIHGSTFGQVLSSYLSVSSRGMTLRQFLEQKSTMVVAEKVLTAILLFALIFPWLVHVLRRRSEPGPGWPIVIVRSFCLLAGLDGFLTNNELALVDFPLLLMAAFFLAAGRSGESARLILPRGWTRYLTFLCVWLACIGLAEGIVRNRVKVIRDFFDFTETSQPFTVPFFKGFHTGRVFHSEVDYIAHLCATEDMSRAFFGDDLKWAYAAFGLQSPKGEPLFWQPGVAIGTGEAPFYRNRWFASRFNPVLMIGTFHMDDAFISGIGLRYGLRTQENFGATYPAPLKVLVLRAEWGAGLPAWPPRE